MYVQFDPATSRPVSPRGVRRLLVRRRWPRPHLQPPAGAFRAVRVVHARLLAEVPVGVLWGRRRRLDVVCGRLCAMPRGPLQDHHGRRGIGGGRNVPPPQATLSEERRAPMPPAASPVDATAPPRPSHVPPTVRPRP